jgi:eukaryotic-like serine/threonine-protein kinase
MAETTSECLDEQAVLAILSGRPAAPRVDEHLRDCPRCRALVIGLQARPQRDGVRVGRYQVRRLLGEGGMGIVYVAYDPELDREVALKLLRPGLESHRDRLVREARIMARLSHPHVVTIHDASSFEGQAFIAMELVNGPNLARWLAAEPRSWRQIARVFVAAGQGLAAAHRAGIVHGDVKPQNVLVDADGRVKVGDFGLARIGAAAVDETTVVADGGSGAGTPAYMAPEQLEGAPADARSDQFGFCVALYQALCGRRPFAGIDPATMRQAFRTPPRWAPLRQRAPRRMTQAIRRGLSVDPSQRFSSMDELLRAIAPRRAATTAVAAAGIAAVAAGLATLYTAAPRVERCDPSPRLIGVWDAPTRAALAGSLRAAGQPELVVDRVDRALDRYVSGWTAAERERCAVAAGEEPELGLLRAHCLEARLEALRAAVQLLSSEDPAVAGPAVDAVDQLGPIERCQTVELVEARVPQPSSPAVRAEVAAIRVELARADVLQRAGRYQEATAMVDGLLARARSTSYRPIEAEVLYSLAVARTTRDAPRAAFDTMREAALAAEAGRHDRIAAEAWSYLVWLAAEPLGDAALGQDMARQAAAALERLGHPPAVEAYYRYYVGVLDLQLARYDRALANVTRAIELFEESGQTFEAANAREIVATVHARQGRFPEELAVRRAIHESNLRTFGADHPYLSRSLNNLAATLVGVGEIDEAVALLRDALRVLEANVAPEHIDLARAHVSLAQGLSEAGRFDEALGHFGKAQRIYAAAGGGGPVDMARCLGGEAGSLERLGRVREAIARVEQAIALLEQRAPQAPELAELHAFLAALLRRDRNLDEAFAHARRARDAFGSASPADAALALGEEGLVHLDARRPGRAREALERAVAALAGSALDPARQAPLWFGLARALGTAERTRALGLARQARTAFSRRADVHARELAEVDAWIAARR